MFLLFQVHTLINFLQLLTSTLFSVTGSTQNTIYTPFSCLLQTYQLYLFLRLALCFMTLTLLRSQGQVFCSTSHYYNFSGVFFSDHTVCTDFGKEDMEVMCRFHHRHLDSPLSHRAQPTHQKCPWVFTGIFPEPDQPTAPQNCPDPRFHHLSLGWFWQLFNGLFFHFPPHKEARVILFFFFQCKLSRFTPQLKAASEFLFQSRERS